MVGAVGWATAVGWLTERPPADRASGTDRKTLQGLAPSARTFGPSTGHSGATAPESHRLPHNVRMALTVGARAERCQRSGPAASGEPEPVRDDAPTEPARHLGRGGPGPTCSCG